MNGGLTSVIIAAEQLKRDAFHASGRPVNLASRSAAVLGWRSPAAKRCFAMSVIGHEHALGLGGVPQGTG